ncbi:MAG TPA: tripartite tricarboxylate transporter substrate binding protein [Burkholderiales bacterium]|nr:tripartite tricarboxylate transporter substrate binding protein [Burkholderiales bacterium]
MKRRAFLASTLALAGFSRLSFAQDRYPERPIRLVVPFAPGGDGDLMARMWAKYAAPLVGGTFVVENKAGAGGAIGATEVARASPDGYTLLLGTTTTQIINPGTLAKPAYDAVKDFALIGMVSMTPTCIIVNPAVPAKSLQELVALVKASPGKYSYGSAGPGTVTNLTGELFKLQAGRLEMTHVPYKGGGPAMQDLIAGHVPVITPILSSAVLAQHRAGRARILGVNSDRRLKAAPELPTSIEGGVPDMRVQVFNAVFAPAGTPRAAMDALRQATVAMRSDAAFVQDIEKAGAELFTHPDEEQFVREEAARWTRVIRDIGFELR